MSDSFTFNGFHSEYDMDLYTEFKSRPLFAEPKTIYEDIPGVDGEQIFTLCNPKGRMCFKPRIIEMECHLAGENESREDYTNKISRIANILATGDNKLITLSDEELYYYKGHAANLFNIENITDFSGTFPLVFKCEPFKYDRQNIDITGDTSVTVNNPGYFVPPFITVTGTMPSGFTIILSETGKTFNVDTPINNNTVTINMEKMDVTMNGVSILHKCNGEFFELSPGYSQIKLQDLNGGNATIRVVFTPRYL